MATKIQDIEKLECDIYEVVEEYIQCRECYEYPQLKINRCDEGLNIDIIDSKEKTDTSDETTYEMCGLVLEEDGMLVPDIDRVNEIANKWLFLD